MGDGSKAFVKGGVGCIVAFLGIGLLVALMGGHVHLDCGGAGLLFIIGGVIGLIFLAVYKKGFSKGQEIAPDPHRRSPSLWTCLACGTDNAPAAKICQNCHEPR